MLDFLRKRRRSWVITFFLAIIVITFVLYFGGGYVKQPRWESIAEVNGEEISQGEFEIHYQRVVEAYRSLFKGELTPEALKSLNVRGAVLEQLIQRRLLLQEARRLGLEVTDEELRDAIARAPEFQIDGRFNENRYLQTLRANKLNPARFEIEHREQLTIQRLYDVIQDTVRLTEAEVRERYRLEQESVSFYFIRLSANDFAPQVEVKAEEVKKYYDSNKEGFKEPLTLQVEYLAYPLDHFFSKVQVSEKEIEEFYKVHQDTRFHQPRAVRLRHILFRVPAGADLKQKEMVRLRAEAVLQEAQGGKDFAALAKKYSEDASAAQGGDVGWFSQGQILPPLDQAAFALKKGEVSAVVETSLGYHILKVDETKEEKSRGRQEVRGEIIQTLKAERAKSEAAKAVDADRQKALSGTDFSELAKERGIPLRVTPFFARFDVLPEVGPAQEFNKIAFSLAPKEISPAVDGPKAYYLLRVKQRKEPTIPPLDNVRSEIEKRLRETKAFEMATEKGNALLGQLKKEKDVRKLATEHGLVIEETGWFLRNVSEIPKVGGLQEVRPGGIAISEQQPIPDRIYTQKGAIYLFALKESRGADMGRFENEKARLLEQALAEKRQKALQKLLDSLKAKARIKLTAQSFAEG